MQSSRTVEGAITEYEWGNPHVYLSVRESISGTVWVVEAFASFTASAFKEAIVFLSIIPVLILRSLAHRRLQEEE